jgi:hypothetical protein
MLAAERQLTIWSPQLTFDVSVNDAILVEEGQGD